LTQYCGEITRTSCFSFFWKNERREEREGKESGHYVDGGERGGGQGGRSENITSYYFTRFPDNLHTRDLKERDH